MKRLLFLFIVLVPLVMQAQFGLGITAGVNNSTVQFNGDFFSSDPANRLGYFVGVAPYYKLSKQTRAVVNLQFSQKGFGSLDIDDPNSNSWRYSYLDVIPEVEHDVLSFLTIAVGVNVGFKTEEAFREARGVWLDPNTNSIKDLDWGLSGKAALKINRIAGFIRYNLGVMNINNLRWTDINGQPIEDASQRNRNVQLGITYNLSKQ